MRTGAAQPRVDRLDPCGRHASAVLPVDGYSSLSRTRSLPWASPIHAGARNVSAKVSSESTTPVTIAPRRQNTFAVGPHDLVDGPTEVASAPADGDCLADDVVDVIEEERLPAAAEKDHTPPGGDAIERTRDVRHHPRRLEHHIDRRPAAREELVDVDHRVAPLFGEALAHRARLHHENAPSAMDEPAHHRAVQSDRAATPRLRSSDRSVSTRCGRAKPSSMKAWIAARSHRCTRSVTSVPRRNRDLTWRVRPPSRALR